MVIIIVTHILQAHQQTSHPRTTARLSSYESQPGVMSATILYPSTLCAVRSFFLNNFLGWCFINRTSFRHHHRHHQVARPAVSIVVSTTERHLERSCARSHAKLRPRLVGCRSDSMVRSQVRRGRPLQRRQSVGRRLMAA